MAEMPLGEPFMRKKLSYQRRTREFPKKHGKSPLIKPFYMAKIYRSRLLDS